MVLVSLAWSSRSQSAPDLDEQFLHPPVSARPCTLWMWMNGNVTADGITRDLEAMRRVGLGGAVIFNIGEYIPKGPVDYGGAAWLKLMTHAAQEADRLGLQLGMHNAPGWSSSGGPWITPEMSMQQLVWTETKVSGPREETISLRQPFTRLNCYRDSVVLAFPSLPGEEKPFADDLARVKTAAGQEVEKNAMTDANLDTGIQTTPQNPLVFEFNKPFEARSVTVFPKPGGAAGAFALEASDDGTHFHNIARLTPPGPRSIGDAPLTENFEAVRACFFRLTPQRPREVLEFELHPAPRIEGWHYKANFSYRAVDDSRPPAEFPKEFVVAATNIVDLTGRMDSQGRLKWSVPAGSWTILRIGYTPKGQRNIAAPDSGLGLECDKLDAAGMEFHFQHGIEPLLNALGPFTGKSFTGLEVDSYEVGMQNWSATFPGEFRKRNGYDLRRYLPAMLGYCVGSVDVSERFLWDVRRTQAELVADNYYGRLRELCRAHHLQLFVEPYGAGPGPYDELQVGGRADVPMGEFWAHFPWDDTPSIRLAASAAHVYGGRIVAAESFTATEEQSRFLDYPCALKTTGDLAFSLGLNKMFFHRYAHQPHPTAAPGMTMGPWGFQFDRNNTWFEQSRGWLDYLARCQFLLQQGRFVADVLYFTGEGSPQMSKRLTPELPAGYTFDAANAEILMKRARIENGRIVLPDGMSYRLLMLPDHLRSDTPELLRRLRELVEQGATIVGPKPVRPPTLRGFPESDAGFQRLADSIWDGTNKNVLGDESIGEALRQLGLKPDFEYTGARPDMALVWMHRRFGDADVYFVANRQRRSDDAVGLFRVDRKRPEFWQPEKGRISDAPVYDFQDGRTRVPMHFGPAESVFVLFRANADAAPPRWLTKDGARLVDCDLSPDSSSNPASSVSNNFTITAWINPNTYFQTMPRESLEARVDDAGKSCVVPAPDGEALFGGGHLAMGIAAARNGVVVLERGGEMSSAVLVARTAIGGWTHLAVVYRDGTPRLYLNGKFVREGLRSGHIVHPAMGVPPPQRRIINYFDGDMISPELITNTLNDEQIAALAAKGLPTPDDPVEIELIRSADGNEEALVWNSGRFALSDGRTLEAKVDPPMEIRGPWKVAFPAGLGAPSSITLPELMPLEKHSNPDVKYFSGTAIYSCVFNVPVNSLAQSKRLFLDLGRVAVSAEVRVNGRDLGVVWKPPFRLDITGAAHPGTNQLEVRVANLWVNRLIGDEQLPPENEYNPRTHAIERLPDWYLNGEPKPGARVGFVTWKFYGKDDPLPASGLLGPVRLFNPVEGKFSKK